MLEQVVEAPSTSLKIDEAARRPAPTVALTVRLKTDRWQRLDRLVAHYQTTKQRFAEQALETRMALVERRHEARRVASSQIGLFDATTVLASAPTRAREPAEPDPRITGTIGVGYRATERMHRWLHAESNRRGITIQDLITDALRRAGGPA